MFGSFHLFIRNKINIIYKLLVVSLYVVWESWQRFSIDELRKFSLIECTKNNFFLLLWSHFYFSPKFLLNLFYRVWGRFNFISFFPISVHSYYSFNFFISVALLYTVYRVSLTYLNWIVSDFMYSIMKYLCSNSANFSVS